MKKAVEEGDLKKGDRLYLGRFYYPVNEQKKTLVFDFRVPCSLVESTAVRPSKKKKY